MQEAKGRANQLSQQLAVGICVSWAACVWQEHTGGVCVYLCGVLFSSATSVCCVCTQGWLSHSCCPSPSPAEGPALLWAVTSTCVSSVPCSPERSELPGSSAQCLGKGFCPPV